MIERTGVFRSPSDLGARFVQGLVWLFTILFALNAAGTSGQCGAGNQVRGLHSPT